MQSHTHTHTQVFEYSRDFKDLLNVAAAVQNILDPAHFQGQIPPMKKVAERLVACGFKETMEQFCSNPRLYFDMPQ
jgi:hypothetical protein